MYVARSMTAQKHFGERAIASTWDDYANHFLFLSLEIVVIEMYLQFAIMERNKQLKQQHVERQLVEHHQGTST